MNKGIYIVILDICEISACSLFQFGFVIFKCGLEVKGEVGGCHGI